MRSMAYDNDYDDNDEYDDQDVASPWLEISTWWQAGTQRELPLS